MFTRAFLIAVYDNKTKHKFIDDYQRLIYIYVQTDSIKEMHVMTTFIKFYGHTDFSPTLLSSYRQLSLICLLLCYPHTGSYPSYASYCTLLSSYRQVSLICLLLSYPHTAGIFHSFFCSAILIRTAFPRYYNFSLLGYPQTGNLAILALG